MGTFQIVYDDFSGGQYMGPRDTNLPKNTWFGDNVATTPNGRAMPVGYLTATTSKLGSTVDDGYIRDLWQVGNYGYAFVVWRVSGVNTPRMVKFQVNDGTNFPVTSTVTTLTGTVSGRVAYDPTNTKFFYVDSGNIRTVTTGGTTATASTALSATGVTNIALYGYRMVVWGGSSKKLYYSDTDLVTYSTGNYYEFNGEILNVLPRANDLLVFCTTGVYSMVGVLGASVSSQLIVPQDNVTEGMKDAAIIGRSAYFLDQLYDGQIDGRIYRLNGATVEPVFTMDPDDITNELMDSASPARLSVVNNGLLAVQLQSGISYAMTSAGVWARYTQTIDIPDPALAEQYLLGRPGPGAQNEYFLSSYLDEEDNYAFVCNRVIRSVPAPTYKDENFVYSGGSSTPVEYATGTIFLSEYWHNKPFSVKQALVQWGNLNTYSQVVVSVEQTGLLDATPQTGQNNNSSFTMTTTNDRADDVLIRAYPNRANKGYGVKPYLSIRHATLKRVILICED